MASSRRSRRAMAIARREREEERGAFVAEVRDSLPRVALCGATAWEANARSIEASIEADRWLAEHGFDRWGRAACRRGGDDA
jgi:hypothetical protein